VKKIVFLLALSAVMHGQNLKLCRERFNQYLNWKNSLNSIVKFDADALYLYSAGKKEFAIYSDELNIMAHLFENSTVEDQMRIMKAKGTRRYSQKEKDSLLVAVDDEREVIRQKDSLPLRGYKIAIDPGHFGTTLKEAEVEQKFLYFTRPAAEGKGSDTVQLFESTLTFNTAKILQSILEEQGAKVFLTREQANFTSFNCTFDDWMQLHKKRSLDSLRQNDQISAARYNQLVRSNNYNFFWNFFRDYDLANRAKKVNEFAPHVTLIIHYNVDEKNAPWKANTKKNFTMAFIGGAFTAANVDRLENKMHLLRMIVTDQLWRSEKLAGNTVANFNRVLQVPVAGPGSAQYLRDNCMATATPGVFCRNLVLCRKINSALVYGESLYQDNEKECAELMKCDVDAYGIKTSERLVKVANCYYEAVFDFLIN
jgi:hypothetical protein